ncbi:NUDIX domain-containing protein [Streptomyces sp. AP-93]|uniref:NUDIX domain-containing protein n=1 Tax=Streptomyces sp. AP-93 TaxID=2929048 RepID=UPI001FAF4D2D|nr:NUDIX domain-containing protein [Streptomyces sp. AP-93]MCJ0868092.1 NUDIX domain-containing protein [Streptomyces sp. AP-93]
MTSAPVPARVPHHLDVHVLLYGADGSVLFGRRRGKPVWQGYFQLPSGRLDPGEPLRAGAARELKEETGVTVVPEALDMVHVVHHRSPYGTDRAGFFFAAREWTGTVVNTEPELCEGWEWRAPGTRPEPLAPYLVQALEHVAQGLRYSEFGWTDTSDRRMP